MVPGSIPDRVDQCQTRIVRNLGTYCVLSVVLIEKPTETRFAEQKPPLNWPDKLSSLPADKRKRGQQSVGSSWSSVEPRDLITDVLGSLNKMNFENLIKSRLNVRIKIFKINLNAQFNLTISIQVREVHFS